MSNQDRAYNRKFLLGYSLLSLLAFGLVVALLSFTVSQLREDGYYENGRLLSEHSIYNTLPSSFRLDASFTTLDDLPDVYDYYSQKYNMSSAQQGIGACLYSDSTQTEGRFNLTVSVFICQGQTEQIGYVTRTFFLR